MAPPYGDCENYDEDSNKQNNAFTDEYNDIGYSFTVSSILTNFHFGPSIFTSYALNSL